MAAISDIKALVTDNGGVLTMPVRDLRDAYGSDRLGKHVRDGISNALRREGLGHYPAELPDRQDRQVRVFQEGTRVAILIDAVLHPSPEHDDELRRVVQSSDAETLARVRELVCS